MCDTLVVVRPEGVWFAKNSDRDPNEAQVLDWQPRREHGNESPLRCTWVTIPQVPRTHAVLLSRPFWSWGAEMGANEHGVVIGNEAVFTRRPVAAKGLTGMDLVRLGLERATTAHGAVEVIRRLVESPGQGGGAGHEHPGFRYHNSFLVADPGGAFVLETAGRRWAVERVQGARSISNGLTIEPFATRWRDPLRTAVAQAARRRSCTTRAAREATGPLDLMRALRDHGPGQPHPRYALLNGALSAPCVHAGGLVAASQTTASWVADLRDGTHTHWVTGTAAPCTSLFFPVHVTTPLDLGPPPGDTFQGTALWWRHEALHRRLMRDPARAPADIWAERDALESRWVAAPPAPATALAAAAAWRDRAEAQLAGRRLRDRRPPWVRRYWWVRNRRAGLHLEA